ncbi:pseudouridine synthase family protein [Calditerrivibrio nitroreducens]|uniref:Pseudouridine synthase n=1 Tax=Calditerrivibrio nitroreducens (strain DSM 19672 / NBRC 101217 / Yu37-1) TaxID=768670 RepID=E4TG02_CALNY|nr:RNA pseudouridine synthase [Calditerrivibrio nitroreducens]ADR18552.1 pseudouridine synthase [Calditerrivibrio nitroreducens DSM 19672]
MKVSDIISKQYNISKRLAKKYLKERRVSYQGKIVKDDYIVDQFDDKFVLEVSCPDIDFNLKDFLLDDLGDIIFFYKPPFMHTERHKPTDELCLSDILNNEFKDFRFISRLDFETDGVIAAIKTGYQPVKVHKRYRAWVKGILNEIIIFDKKIDANKRKKVSIIDEKGDNFLRIKPVKHYTFYTLVDVGIDFAHRHQIRAALSYLNFPILGDKLYGDGDYERLLLQCYFTEIDGISICLDDIRPELSIASLQNFQ